MELREIEKQAKALMTVHGVGRLEFAFDNGKRRLGACHSKIVAGKVHVPYKITLSKHYAVLLPEDEIREVILHEIAHALTPGRGHDAVWRATARKIGAKGNRCVTPSAKPEAPIVGYCMTCDKKVSEHHRLPRAVYLCSSCRSVLTYRRDGSEVVISDMPRDYIRKYSAALDAGRIRV